MTNKLPDEVIYECTGCGRVTKEPQEDLELLKRAGHITCCPERKMVPAAPKVKPLVWQGLSSGPYEIVITDGGVGHLYNYANRDEDNEPEYMHGGFLTLISIDQFKAAAQADYERRILAALA